MVKRYRRNLFEVIKDILASCNESPVPMATISRRANMDFNKADRYCKLLQDIGILQKAYDSSREYPATVWSCTHDGILFNIFLTRIMENHEKFR